MPDEVLAKFINREEVAPTLLMKDKNGFSPFHYALRTLRPEICDLLLSKGATLLEPDPNGLTALHHIAAQSLQTYRSSSAEDVMGLDVFLADDHFDQCLGLWQRFVADGCSVNAVDNAGDTPLHKYLLSPAKRPRPDDEDCCHFDHYEKLFPPSSDVDVFAANRDGETALHVIAKREKGYNSESEHDQVMFWAMMEKGLDPLKEDVRGRSALDVASACEKDDIVGMLGRG
jgi:ankyrin repeat protein